MCTQTALDQNLWSAAVDQTNKSIDRLNTHKLVIKLKLIARAHHLFFISFHFNTRTAATNNCSDYFFFFIHARYIPIWLSIQIPIYNGIAFCSASVFMNSTFTMVGDKHTLVASNEPVIIIITIAFVSQ